MDKKNSRLRRARRVRAKIRELAVPRLSVFRTSKHIYAQIIDANGSDVITSASTVQTEIKSAVKYTGNAEAAAVVGKAIAEKAKSAGIESVAFDRSGFRYHGRVKALADAAREAGLKI